MASCFDYLIELKQKMIILLEFVTKKFFFVDFDNKTKFLIKLNVILKTENKISDVSCASCFNRVIELNQKMLILSKYLTNKLYFM